MHPVVALFSSVSELFDTEKEVGDRGIVMVDQYDPIAMAKALLAMDVYTVIAYTEQDLFHRLLEKFARPDPDGPNPFVLVPGRSFERYQSVVHMCIDF